jgi:hypothetical protein
VSPSPSRPLPEPKIKTKSTETKTILLIDGTMIAAIGAMWMSLAITNLNDKTPCVSVKGGLVGGIQD